MLSLIKGIAIGLGVGLIIGGISGYKVCTSGMWKAVVKDQAKQATGVEKLHKGELKDTKVLVKTIYKLRANTTKCGKTNMRPIDIEAQQ